MQLQWQLTRVRDAQGDRSEQRRYAAVLVLKEGASTSIIQRSLSNTSPISCLQPLSAVVTLSRVPENATNARSALHRLLPRLAVMWAAWCAASRPSSAVCRRSGFSAATACFFALNLLQIALSLARRVY